MSTLRMSSTIAQNIIYVQSGDAPAFVGYAVGGSFPSGLNNPYPFGGWVSGFSTINSSRLAIYKGTPGTFPGLTDLSSRSSDLLITFTLSQDVSSQNLGIVDQKARWLIGKDLTIRVATGSGTASWFVAYGLAGTNMSNRGAIIGSVGTPGTGADLEIPNIEIVSGANYQCAGFYINMPQSRTF